MLWSIFRRNRLQLDSQVFRLVQRGSSALWQFDFSNDGTPTADCHAAHLGAERPPSSAEVLRTRAEMKGNSPRFAPPDALRTRELPYDERRARRKTAAFCTRYMGPHSPMQNVSADQQSS